MSPSLHGALATTLLAGALLMPSTSEYEPDFGKPVRDGKFEFVVEKAECGVSYIGDEPYGEAAQGQFCLVTMTVKNIGNRGQYMSDSDQKAVGSNGFQYSSNTFAGIVLNGNQSLNTEINPGNQVRGVIVYDIPKDTSLAKLELHDSFMSGGVDVNLQ